MNKMSIRKGWRVRNSLCHIFFQLPEPESISISTVGISNFSLLRCHHIHMLGTTDMHYPHTLSKKQVHKNSVCLCSWTATGHTIRIFWIFIFLINTWHFAFRHKMHLRSTYLENRSFLAYSQHSLSRQNSLWLQINVTKMHDIQHSTESLSHNLSVCAAYYANWTP